MTQFHESRLGERLAAGSPYPKHADDPALAKNDRSIDTDGADQPLSKNAMMTNYV